MHGTPCCRNPTPRPTSLVSSVTSLVCWKQPQQPSRAGAAREVSTDSSALFQGKKRNTIPSHLLWWPRLTSQCLSLPGSGIIKTCESLRDPGAQGRKVRIKTIRTTGSQTPLYHLPAQHCPFPPLYTQCHMRGITLHVLTSPEPSVLSLPCFPFLQSPGIPPPWASRSSLLPSSASLGSDRQGGCPRFTLRVCELSSSVRAPCSGHRP